MDKLGGFFIPGPYDSGDPVMGHYYEIPSDDPTRPQVWGYTNGLTFAPGEHLALHAIANAPEISMVITRDGATPEQVLKCTIPGCLAPTPADCSVTGCNWPERWAIDIPTDWRSGVYRIALTVPGHTAEHMFVLRRAEGQPRADVLLMLSTSTWCAYNDWGGSNHYQGLCGPDGRDFAAEVSLLRPWATGFVSWPDGAPRIPHASPPLTRPRYPHMDYARANGVSKKYASSGWAAFERPFALWCEAEGISLDFTTQHDLHRDAAALDGYGRVAIVGHDEYWTWEMRDHLDAWIDAGGELARFAGNFFWQTRLSADGLTQTCYKSRAAEDPTDNRSRLTSYWDNPELGRPAAASMGLTGAMGVYAGWSRCAAHGTGGFTIYRPQHWAMAGSGLGYGDVLGRNSTIFGYEVDGLDYTMTQGLPYPAEGTGIKGRLTIIGMAPATTLAHSTGPDDTDPFIGQDDVREVAEVVYGDTSPETVARAARGNGMMAHYQRGKGAVFNAGSCEWVAGLIKRDDPVIKVTRNLLLGAWRNV